MPPRRRPQGQTGAGYRRAGQLSGGTMDNIQLLYVANTVSGKAAASTQTLQFLIRVANLGYGKTVEVHWAGEDGVWRRVLADYCASAGDGSEYWRAEVAFPRQPGPNCPATSISLLGWNMKAASIGITTTVA